MFTLIVILFLIEFALLLVLSFKIIDAIFDDDGEDDLLEAEMLKVEAEIKKRKRRKYYPSKKEQEYNTTTWD